MTSHDLTDGALGRHDGQLRDGQSSSPTPSVTVAGVDLDALEKVARAATQKPFARYRNRHSAAFDPPTVLKLIALARAQEPAVAGVDEVEEAALIIDSRALTIQWTGTEDEQAAIRMAACHSRREQWGQDDCENQDGSCSECEHDMAEQLETPASRARREAVFTKARAILALQSTREPTIGEDDQGSSSVAGVPCAQTHTPTPSPAGGQG